MFLSREELDDQAYLIQGQLIAYQETVESDERKNYCIAMKIFTIGFTQTSAESFFTRLKRSGAKTLIDVRLNNVSQLAGFAKKNDLQYFVRNLCGMGYTHIPALAPTKVILDEYRERR